jgi:Ca2+-binding RTX toxin-like protein
MMRSCSGPDTETVRRLLVLAVLTASVLIAPTAASGQDADLCRGTPAGVKCQPGNGRQTPGGGEKVSHRGWPAVTGVLWQVIDSSDRAMVGGPVNDELLGHHGSDRLDGGPGRDVLWGDWDPSGNTPAQHDVLRGGAGNDFIYPSHGTTEVDAGPGNDYIWAFYGHGTIDCGPGRDTVRVRLNAAFRLRNCEVVNHFCAFGSDGHGGCRKPGQARAARRAYVTSR